MRLTALSALLAATILSAPAADAARPIAFARTAPTSGAVVLPLASAADIATRGAALDAATRDAVTRALAAAKFDYKPRTTLSLRGIGPWSQVLVVGVGTGTLASAQLQDVAGLAARTLAKEEGAVTILADGLAGGDAAQLGIGAALGSYSFDKYKYRAPDAPKPAAPQPITIVTSDTAAEARYRRDGLPLYEAVAFARDLTTEPSNNKYPETFVERTREAFRGVSGVRIEALDVPAMERLGMGSILSVGKGSARPPRMLVVEYKGSGAPANPIVLAGKGITFDSGGISLKPGAGMWYMKDDMAGAAAVVAAVLSLARSQAPVNVVAIAALAENMPGGTATRPGDVVKAMNGKSIEILNTDAEGRLVLADAVAYAENRWDPAAIVDVATLTGAVGGALGRDYAGLFTRHDALGQQLIAAGKATGEPLWQLPLADTLADAMKSDIADIKNVVEGGGGAGASLGAHFIGYFAEPTTPWAHIDIASLAWANEALPTVPKGAAGYSVRLLDRFVRDFRPVAREAGTGGK